MLEPRYGIWVPIHGNWGPHDHPDDPADASYARTKSLVTEAEKIGFTTTLVAQHLINPRNQDFDELETWTASAALAEATDRIEIIAAIKPFLFHPAVLAKMTLGIDAISSGRFAINLVSAWFRPELEKTGIGFLPHDERYQYSGEWLRIVKALLSGDRVSFQGQYFQIRDLSFRPKAIVPPFPRIYLGGESEPARNLAAQLADVFFINGRPIKEVQNMIADVSSRPRLLPDPLRFALSAFVIARPTVAEAQEEFDYLMTLQKQTDISQLRAGIDPQVEMFKTSAKYQAVGTNGGTAAGLVGNYDMVAARIAEFVESGIEMFMLQFLPIAPEFHRFAAEIMPRVRRLQRVA